MICSESKLDAEIKFISTTLFNNCFPLNVVRIVINNEITDFNKIKEVSVQRRPVYLRLPWLCRISDRFAKQIFQTVPRCYFFANVRIVFWIRTILVSIHKDDLHPPHNNSLIYSFRCSCGSHYIGKKQRLDARIKHVLYSHLHHHSASQRHNIKDRRMNKRRMIKTQEGRRKKSSLEKYSPLTLLKGFERAVQGLHVRGSLRPNINFIFWPHCYDRHVVSFLFS